MKSSLFCTILGLSLIIACSQPPAMQKASTGSGKPIGAEPDTQDQRGEQTKDPKDDPKDNAPKPTPDQTQKDPDPGRLPTEGEGETQTDTFDGAFPIAASLMSSGWIWERGPDLLQWSSTNSFHAIVDYMYVSGSREYLYLIEKIYNANVNKGEKNFINEFYDDTAWWGLAWMKAYDVTKDQKYLNAAKKIADYETNEGWDEKKCGGGLFWKRQEYKSAISNGLYMKLLAGLHNRSPGDTKYLELAKRSWKWFVAAGLIDKNNLIVDGVKEDSCKAGGEHFTYNQGVILGAAAELYLATQDQSYLDLAEKLAKASMGSVADNDGIITEKARGGCKASDNHGDELYFKGAYVRNLRELNEILKNKSISEYLRNSAKAAWNNSRASYDAIGYCWQGPFDKMEPGRITAALDLMTASLSGKYKNLALRKSAQSTHDSCNAEQGAKAAVDGDTQTKWCATGAETTLDIDLGSIQDLHRIRVWHAGSAGVLGDKKENNTKDFELFIAKSPEGPWTSVAKVSGNTASGTSHAFQGKAQFVRLKVTNAGADGVTRITDVAVE